MRWGFVKRNILIFSVAFLFTVTCTWAQHSTASLRGSVTDEKGASVPGALITLESTSLGLSLSVKTDKDGGYQFLELRPATYTITVTSPGFATLRQSGLELLLATSRTEDFKMQVASVSTTVEVTGTAQNINTTDASLGNAF